MPEATTMIPPIKTSTKLPKVNVEPLLRVTMVAITVARTVFSDI